VPADARMPVLMVVVRDERVEPFAGVGQRAEPFGIVRHVLRGLELGLTVGGVVGDFGPRVRPGHPEIDQQLGDFPGGHRGAAVRLHGLGHDAVAGDGLADQLLGLFGRFGLLHGVADDVAGVDVDDHVGVIPDALGRSGRFGDVPGEHLRRSGGHEFGHRLGGVGGLPSAFGRLSLFAQDLVHRGHRAVVAPGVQLTGPDLGGREFGVLSRVHQLQNCRPLVGRQGRGLDLRLPGLSLWCGPQPAVVGGA